MSWIPLSKLALRVGAFGVSLGMQLGMQAAVVLSFAFFPCGTLASMPGRRPLSCTAAASSWGASSNLLQLQTHLDQDVVLEDESSTTASPTQATSTRHKYPWPTAGAGVGGLVVLLAVSLVYALITSCVARALQEEARRPQRSSLQGRRKSPPRLAPHVAERSAAPPPLQLPTAALWAAARQAPGGAAKQAAASSSRIPAEDIPEDMPGNEQVETEDEVVCLAEAAIAEEVGHMAEAEATGGTCGDISTSSKAEGTGGTLSGGACSGRITPRARGEAVEQCRS